MWLLYLRYDADGVVDTFHVLVDRKGHVPDLIAFAEAHPPRTGARLVEYAVFSSTRTIFVREAPNYHAYTMVGFRNRMADGVAHVDAPPAASAATG